jgi:SUKH-4 immunity protein
MNPEEFKERYLSIIMPSIPSDLDLDIDEFVTYPITKISQLNISQADKDLLIMSGLPDSAAPFLSFGLNISIMLEPLDKLPHCKMLGHTSYGDMICIDESEGGSIVYFNHDCDMARVFMNSSLRSLAHSLCIYAEFWQTRDVERCRKEIGEYDRLAMKEDSFWSIEICTDVEAEIWMGR